MAETENGPALDRFRWGRRRRWGLGLVAAAVVFVVAYNLYWSFAADQVRTGIAQWAGERRAGGLRVTHGGIKVDGYPFRLRATVTGPAIADFTAAQPWSWRGPVLTLTARPWQPWRIRLRAPGRHWLLMAVGGNPAEITIEAADLTLKLKHRGGGLARAMLSMRGVKFTDAAGGGTAAIAAADVIAERLPAGASPPLAILVDAEGIRLPVEPGPGLGRETARLGFSAKVTEGLPGALDGGQPVRDALSAWRDKGGTVEVGDIVLRHGPLSLGGDGTLALDGGLQPMGAFSVRVGGFATVIDALRIAGAVDPHTAALAKTVLRSLAKEEAAGGGPAIDIPISLQERWLYLGPVPLVRLRRVAWD